MIVLTQTQKSGLDSLLIQIRTEMNDEGLDIVPVAIKNNLYILPESVLTDSRARMIYGYLIENSTIREVLQSELIVYEI